MRGRFDVPAWPWAGEEGGQAQDWVYNTKFLVTIKYMTCCTNPTPHARPRRRHAASAARARPPGGGAALPGRSLNLNSDRFPRGATQTHGRRHDSFNRSCHSPHEAPPLTAAGWPRLS